MVIFVRDARKLDLVNVSVCLLTVYRTSVSLSRRWSGLKMYEDTKWHKVISNLKQYSVDMPILYVDFLCRLYG